MIDVEEIAKQLGESDNISKNVLHAFDIYLSHKGAVSMCTAPQKLDTKLLGCFL